MSNEYYHQLYTHTMAQYNSELADANADLVRAQASGDFAGAVSAAQRMANTRANAAAFHQIAEEQAATMRGPPSPPEPTREERHARTWDRMTYDDALELANQSK
jgi:hypothetical protein